MITLDGPLEESLAGLTGRHAIMVTRGKVSTDQTQPFRPHGAHWSPIVASEDGVHLKNRGWTKHQPKPCKHLLFLTQSSLFKMITAASSEHLR